MQYFLYKDMCVCHSVFAKSLAEIYTRGSNALVKKFLFMPLFVVWTFLFCFGGTVAAAPSQIAVVIVGSSDFKTKDYLDTIKKYLAEPFDETNITVSYGNDIQTQYQEYWLDKGELDEQRPKKQDLLDFVGYGNYGKVLYIVLNDPVVESSGRGKRSDYIRASIGMNAFLVGKDKIIETKNVTYESVSKTSILRAKRDAFKKCIEDVSKTMLPLMKQKKY